MTARNSNRWASDLLSETSSVRQATARITCLDKGLFYLLPGELSKPFFTAFDLVILSPYIRLTSSHHHLRGLGRTISPSPFWSVVCDSSLTAHLVLGNDLLQLHPNHPLLSTPQSDHNMSLPANVHVSRHPCLVSKLSQLRSGSVSPKEVKALVHEISLIVGCEALATAVTAVPGPKVRLPRSCDFIVDEEERGK